ncbi:MAG TPA: DUF983 domain-containing protein [Fluviicola sp.]|nr:DUF983 domain-containing protein [Fluviicola sp.]
MKIWYILQSVFGNSCPRCHQGKVFSYRNPFNMRQMFKADTHCSHCGLKYEREPGFFYGAMYVSYALTSGWFIAWYVINELWIHLGAWALITLMLVSFVVAAPLTFRASRLIWLNFFIAYDPEARDEHHYPGAVPENRSQGSADHPTKASFKH